MSRRLKAAKSTADYHDPMSDALHQA
jgi:hypothetical protein